MPDTYEGVVVKLSKKRAWSVLMDDETWYGAGFSEPEFAEGDRIKINITTNKGYKNLELVEIVEKAAASASTTETKKGTWKPQDPSVQAEIRYQAALKVAVDIVELGIEVDAVKLPTAVAKRLDALVDIVDGVACDLFDRALAKGEEANDD